MGADTGFGLPGEDTGTGGGADLSGLSENDIPVLRSNALVPSGFTINPMTAALQGMASIETDGDVQAGVSTFRLGLAHAIRSAAENVTFRNTVTDTVFHPTWQTTDSSGDWASVQRTPIGPLVEDFIFQSIDTETITNPEFMFTSLSFNHRLYSVSIEPVSTIDNVTVILQQQNTAGEFVDYWRSREISFTATDPNNPTPQDVVISPFIDLFASQQYRLRASSPDGDVQVLGDTNGIPRITLNYRQWADLPLATAQSLGNFRFDGDIEISASVTITADNLEQYSLKIWLVTATAPIEVTISDNLELNYFAAAVIGSGASLTITRAAGGAVNIGSAQSQQYTEGSVTTFFRAADNDYRILSSNVAGSGLSAADRTKLDGIEVGAEVNVQANWDETDVNSDAFILNKPTIPDALTGSDFTIDGRIDIDSDVTINSANVATYEQQLWFIDDTVTITVEEGSGLTFFGIYVRTLADSATLTSTAGSNVRFENDTSQVITGRSGKYIFAFNTDRFRNLLTNSIGVIVQDNDGTEGRQIQTINFDTNLNVNVEDGVANVEALVGGDPFNEVQNRFLSSLNRAAITLVAQQTGFDLGIFLNPIDTVSTGPGSDLADLNALDTNQFVAANNGQGFVYLLFQGIDTIGENWVLVRTNADRSSAEFLAYLDRDFTEIEVDGASVNLFMSDRRIDYEMGDVIAVYTITGGELIALESDEFNLIRGIPQNSISQNQLNFNVPTTPIANFDWRECSLSSTTGPNTTATFPNSMTLADFNDINVYWNSGTGTPTGGSSGNINRHISSVGSLVVLRSGNLPTNRNLLINAIGRGADQFSIEVDYAASTSTTINLSVINLNNEVQSQIFNITNVWVR